MPLECAVRQKLLEINNIAHRLKEEIMLLERMARVCCCQCGVVVRCGGGGVDGGAWEWARMGMGMHVNR